MNQKMKTTVMRIGGSQAQLPPRWKLPHRYDSQAITRAALATILSLSSLVVNDNLHL